MHINRKLKTALKICEFAKKTIIWTQENNPADSQQLLIFHSFNSHPIRKISRQPNVKLTVDLHHDCAQLYPRMWTWPGVTTPRPRPDLQ